MGLTFDELHELLKHVEEKHSWKNMAENHLGRKPGEPFLKAIKYVSFTIDTRDCVIWSICFNDIVGIKYIKEKIFQADLGYNVKDEIYKWLKDGE